MRINRFFIGAAMFCFLASTPRIASAQSTQPMDETMELVDSTQKEGVEVFSDTTATDTGEQVVLHSSPSTDEEDSFSFHFSNISGLDGWLMGLVAWATLLMFIFLLVSPVLILILIVWLFIRLLNRKPRNTGTDEFLNNNMDMETKKKLYRSNDRVLGGVCGGLAEYFDFDPTIVRVAYALITFFTAFSGIPCYLILWLIMPQRP